MEKTHKLANPSSQDWERLESNPAWLTLLQYLSQARSKNRRALETAKIDYADMRFLQGEQRFLNQILDGDIKTAVGNFVEKNNSK